MKNPENNQENPVKNSYVSAKSSDRTWSISVSVESTSSILKLLSTTHQID